MAPGKKITAREASRLIDQFYKYCSDNGYIRILKPGRIFAHISYFREFIQKNRGIDKSTFYAYRDLMKAYKFIEIDPYERVFFIFRDSPEYIPKDNPSEGLNKWAGE